MNNSLRSIIAVLLCMLLIGSLVLTGCSNSDSDKNEQSEETGEETSNSKAAAVGGITLDKSTLSLSPGDSETLTAVVTPANAISKRVIWSSTNEEVATVDEEGIVTALTEGTAVIVATTVNGKTFICNVTVAFPKIAPTGIALNKDKLELFNGESESLSVTLDPTETTEKEITWTSSAPDVAAVANGVVTAISAGSATITATAANGMSASCSVDILGEKIFYVSGGAIIGLTDYGKTITELSIPAVIKGEQITDIKPRVFSSSNYLTSITLSAGLEKVEKDAFLNCESLEGIYYDGDIADWCKIDFADATAHPLYYIDDLYLRDSSGEYKLMETELVIPDTVTKIGSYSFYNCSSLESITLPKGIEKIGKHAFYNCSSLDVAYYDGDIADWCRIEFGDHRANPLYGAHDLFLKDQSEEYVLVTEIVIPDTVTEIKAYTFFFSSISSVRLPEGLEKIGPWAFSYCRSLGSVTLPTSLERIATSAFSDCNALTSIKYRGSEAQWAQITKGTDWAKNSGSYTITYSYTDE